MGTDIRLIVERKIGGNWVKQLPPKDYPRNQWLVNQAEKIKANSTPQELANPIGTHQYLQELLAEDWCIQRNYRTFAIIADVRNEFSNITPFSLARGLPEDTDFVCEGFSPSWLTLQELLGFDWERKANYSGLITWEKYKKRIAANITGVPDYYIESIHGTNVLVIDEKQAIECYETEKRLLTGGKICGSDLYVRVRWEETYRESVGEFHSVFMTWLQKIDIPENVRIVFYFY